MMNHDLWFWPADGRVWQTLLATAAVMLVTALLLLSLHYLRSTWRWKSALNAYADREIARNRRLDAYAAREIDHNRHRKDPSF